MYAELQMELETKRNKLQAVIKFYRELLWKIFLQNMQPDYMETS